MNMLPAVLLLVMACVSFDRSEVIGKWRFSKIEPGDGTVLDLETLGGIGAEWTFREDGRVFNHAEDEGGRWNLKDKTLTVRFGDDPETPPKRWTIKSLDAQEMVIQRKLKNGNTSTEHLKRLQEE